MQLFNMTVLSPYSSKFTDTYNEIEDLYKQGGLQTKEERTEYIKSKGLDPTEYRKTNLEYQNLLKLFQIKLDVFKLALFMITLL